MIRIRQLNKHFKGRVALADVDLDLDRGEALVLAGTNGSGRSTLLEILATLVRPTSGEVEIDGLDAVRQPLQVRARIGYLGQSPGFHPRLTAGEHLDFVAAARGLPRASRERAVAAALEPIDLRPEAVIGELSPGLRQQLAAAGALLGDPPLLLLDQALEPLDPLARRRFARRLAQRREAGATLVMACHSFDLPSALRYRIAYLHRGRVVTERRDDPNVDPVEVLAALLRGRPPARPGSSPELGGSECSAVS